MNRTFAMRWCAAACTAALVALAVPAALRAQEETVVNVGIVNSASDAPFFIAEKLGYFKQEGIVAKFIPFDAAAKMMAPLGTAQLDVAGGAPSAALYNAIAQNVEVKIVADKGSTPRGYGYLPLLVRTSLVTSGKYKSPRDLKGMKFAEPAQGTGTSAAINKLLAGGGLQYDDVQHIYLGFPQHVPAFENGSIDASLTAEPSATQAVRSGAAVRVMGDDVFYPNQQLSVVLYGGAFVKNKPQLAHKFMVAYIRAVRFYNDALKGNRLRGRTAHDVINILTESTPIKDGSVYAEMVPNGNDPNGRVNVASIVDDYKFFRAKGLVQSDVDAEKIVDMSFADAAVKKLGPYRARK